VQEWVVTRSVDFGVFGIAAAILGAAAKEPLNVIASCCNKGMAVIARKDSPIASIEDLRRRKVAIWPGSTQEVFILERLRMEGMTIKDVEPVRISFSEMHLALARGEVGAEPGPGVSISSGVGKLVEYPYSTPMGSLNMVFGVHPETVEKSPQLMRTILEIDRKASEFAMANPPEMIEMAVAKSVRSARRWPSRSPTSN
jgi:ABC-type nitrate/sulfonate/bicarbonate transport system substrate-binding protein